MRKVLDHVATSARRFAGLFSSLQGAAGVACVAAGAYAAAGLATFLLTLGGFLLLGAWASR